MVCFTVTCANQNARMHVRIHSVRARLRVHPVLHDAHLAAPFIVQAAPVATTPFLQVQLFPTILATNERRMCCQRFALVGLIGTQKNLRTHAFLASFIVNPLLHAAHTTTPFEQSTPGNVTPFLHAHAVATETKPWFLFLSRELIFAA